MYYLQVGTIFACVFMPVVAGPVVAARFKGRKMKKIPLEADDWTILACFVIMVAECIGTIYATYYCGVGQYLLSVSPTTRVKLFKFLYIDVTVTHFLYGFIKISILLFYRRIFAIQWFRRVNNIALAIVVSWTTAAVLSQIFCSDPISDFWKYSGKTRFNWGDWQIVMSGLDIALDLMILSLPLLVISKLKMSTRRKVSVMFIFWVGGFCTATSVVRLYYAIHAKKLADDPLFILQHPYRASAIENGSTLWARIESGSSIVAACLPTLAPLVKDYKPFDSLFSKIRSVLSRSKLSSSPSSGKDDPESNISKKGWVELNNQASARGPYSNSSSEQIIPEAAAG